MAVGIGSAPKGYCTTCKQEVHSIHKCPKCGKFVFVEPGVLKIANREIEKSKREIRVRYEGRIETARTKDNHAAVTQLTAEMDAEIAKLVSQGKS